MTVAGCGTGSGNGQNSAASADTVSIDVGNGTVDVPTSGLRLGILFNAQSNAWQVQVAETAVEEAEALGWDATILDANFDVATQLNQLQSAATSGSFDAVIVVPIDDGECTAITETLPEAGVLVTVLGSTVCDRQEANGEDLWTPGTLNFVGGDTSADYFRSWFDAAAELNPGRQQVAIVAGQEATSFTQVQRAVAEEFQAQNPDFEITDWIYTDYTTPTGYANTLAYLNAHPDTTLLMSVYTPDLTRGVVGAVDAAGRAGDLNIVDVGASSYTIEQIEQGTVQATLGFFPTETGQYAVQAIQDAIDGQEPQRFVSVIPPEAGTVEDPLIITRDNVDSFTPEF